MMVSDEEKRWLVVGIAMNKVVAPVLRDFIKQGMDVHYTNLDIYCSGLATPCTLKMLTFHQISSDPYFKHLKFQNVNNNLQLHGKRKSLYNYSINTSVDLAKLFVPDYLAEFSGFDESLDMSAILRLLGFNKPVPIFYSPKPLMSIQNSADDVRENVRNKWGHCNVTDWTEVQFNDCFSKLETLVRSLGLTGSIEKTSLDLLSDWLTKGCQLCVGHAVDQNLLSLVQQDVKELITNYKKTEAEQSVIQESLAQQRTEQSEMQNTVASIQDQQSSTIDQLQEHNELLNALLEWKEQQVKEKQEIMKKLVSLEKTLSDELLFRVDGLEKGLAKAENEVEQLDRGIAKTIDKMEQVEQGVAKTKDQIEELEQGFAETEDKFEQLEVGFARTDDRVKQLEGRSVETGDKVKQLERGFVKTDYRVEQLQQGFAKVENDVFETGKKVKQLEEEVTSQRMKGNKPGSKTILPRSNLPAKVPHFIGRQEECDETVGHMTSEVTRLVSVWGPPGFGKTSVAIAVGHRLQARELPVYFLSLRELKSKSDLTSKLLGLFRQTGTLETERLQSLSSDDKVCLIFDRLGDHCVVILDNADDLFECGVPNVKEEIINLIGEILHRSNKIKFLLTTRESLSFLNIHFQGHVSVRIKELDEFSSQTLARELLPEVSYYHLTKVSQICGQVPLAIKLMCSSIPEDLVRASQCIDEFLECTENILEMLDNPDYPSNLRLKSLFESSFQRLSTQDQEALVSLCILPDHFDLEIAAAVLGMTKEIEVQRVLQRLQRKSLLDCSNYDKFTMHKLIQSFSREKGENDMRETVLLSKSRFYAFYIGLFEKLNQNFLSGRSMSAFMEFFEDENNIVQSLIEGCWDSKTADRVFDVLTKAELFVDSLYWTGPPHKIFDSAMMAAKQSGKTVFYRRLLISYAFNCLTWGSGGNTKKLLSESKELQLSASSDSDGEIGKFLCYFGIHECVIGKTESGVEALEAALSFLGTSPEHRILSLIVSQILAIYYQCKNDVVNSSQFCIKALKECRDVGDMGLVVIPTTTIVVANEGGERNTPTTKANPLINEPLQCHVIMLVREAVGKFLTTDTKRFFGNLLLKIIKESVSELRTITPGWVKFHGNAVNLLQGFGKYEDAITLTNKMANVHEKALQQSVKRKDEVGESAEKHEEAMARIYSDQGEIHHRNGNYAEALTSYQRALNTRRKLFGEDHSKTADSYRDVGLTHQSLGDYTSALQSHKRALDIRLKLFGEVHPKTADSYRSVGLTQHSLGEYTSALESHKCALDIRIQLFGEEDSRTANSYHSMGVTQHSLGEDTSALESHTRALHIRIKLFDELRAADSHHEIGVAQYSLGDYASAFESHKRAFDIRYLN